MTDRKTIGTIIGAGIVTAGGIAAGAAWAQGKKREIPDWYYGYLRGYSTAPGEEYDVYMERGTDMWELILRPNAIWFEHEADYLKFLYDSLRGKGLPVRGAYVVIGHSRKAGVHSTGRKAPMRGFNNWGVKAGKEYRETGKPFWLANTFEIDRSTMTRYPVEDAKWRFYWSMGDAIDDLLFILLRLYLVAYEEAFSKYPDPARYYYGLEHGTGGRHYATGAFDMAQVIEDAMTRVPRLLNEHFGYNLPMS